MRREERAQAAGSSATTLFDPPPRSIPGLRVLERIGSGGSGVVFRALRTVNGIEHDVAVKWFHAERRARSISIASRASSGCSPRSVTRTSSVSSTPARRANGRPYLVMDLVRTASRSRRACDERRLPLAERLRLMTVGLRRRPGRAPAPHRASRPEAVEHPRHAPTVASSCSISARRSSWTPRRR